MGSLAKRASPRGLPLAAIAATLAASSLPPAAVVAVDAAEEPVGFMLRYYAAYWKRFAVQDFPRQVCYHFPASCIALQVGVCMKTPPGLAAPYIQQKRGLGVQFHMGEEGVGYLLLEKDLSSPTYLLWSGCQEGCEDCRNGHGLAAMPILSSSMCGTTVNQSVFMFMEIDKFNDDENVGCVQSLSSYYGDFTWQHEKYSKDAIVGSTTLALLCMVYVAIACLCRSKFSEDRHQSTEATSNIVDPQQCVARVIGKEEIDRQFPTLCGADVVKATISSTCVVCLLPVTFEEPCKNLQCGHFFHAECILRWWTHEPRYLLTCPMCRQPQLLDDQVVSHHADASGAALGEEAVSVAPIVVAP